MSYDIDEFEALMEASRMGGSSVRNLRLSRSLPSSPLSSPKRSPEQEGKQAEFGAQLDSRLINEEVHDPAAYTNLLVPPDPFQELQAQANGSPGGARPKVAPLSPSARDAGLTPAGAIRRTQSCRRPTASRREQSQISYRQRAHANAWRQHASAAVTDEDADGGKLPEAAGLSNIAEVPKRSTIADDDELQDCKIYRVRSFKTTASGIVNRGDSFKVKSRRQSTKHRTPRTPHNRRYSIETASDSLSSRDDLLSIAESPPLRHPAVVALSSGSPVPTRPNVLNVQDSPKSESGDSDVKMSGNRAYRDRFLSVGATLEPEIEVEEEQEEEQEEPIEEEEEEEDESSVFKVVVIGTQGVGKTTLTRQLLTSEYLANTDRYQDDDNEKVKIVSVQLDDEESTVQFINVQTFEEAKEIENVDAYVIVFSVTDRNSFAYAHACLQDLTRKGAPSRKKVMIVVANKQDIMRNRVVTEQEARSLASHRHCKYTEVSALLDHKVDELLVGIIRQIRIKQAKLQQQSTKASGEAGDLRPIGCLQRAAVGLFRRLFKKRANGGKKNCDNLLSP